VVRQWGRFCIPECCLADDGYEEWPHVTLKYGFTDHPLLLGRLRAFFDSVPPVKIKVSGLSFFPDSGDGDVLKLDVVSDDLHDLYHLVSDHFDCQDKWYPDYKPHVTIAYLQPGQGKKYADLVPPPDLVMVCSSLVYGEAAGIKHSIRLRGRYGMKTLSAMDVTAGGALVAPPAFLKPFGGRERKKILIPTVRQWARDGDRSAG